MLPHTKISKRLLTLSCLPVHEFFSLRHSQLRVPIATLVNLFVLLASLSISYLSISSSVEVANQLAMFSLAVCKVMCKATTHQSRELDICSWKLRVAHATYRLFTSRLVDNLICRVNRFPELAVGS